MVSTDATDWAEADLPFTVEDRRALLASVLGTGLTPRDLAGMVGEGYLRLLTAERGEILALPGTPQREFFLVLDGELEVARNGADGHRQLMDTVTSGGACGAVPAFSLRAIWPATVQVAADARLLAVAAPALLADAPPTVPRQRLLQNCLLLLADRATHLRRRGDLLVRRGLRERLSIYLLRHADAEGHVSVSLTRQSLADHLSVSRASMTREVGRMIDDGLIALRGRGFVILDRARLEELAA